MSPTLCSPRSGPACGRCGDNLVLEPAARCVAHCRAAVPGSQRKLSINHSITIGRYLVSPLSRPLQDGRHAASVSIRSGRGSATHDRVMRLLPLFDSAEAALRHAAVEGRNWVLSSAAFMPTQP